MDGKIILIGFMVGIIITAGIGAGWYFGTYNGLITKKVDVEAKWSEVQNQYQRRYDLIPSLVNATKIYINYETNLLTSIAEARSQWGKSLSQPVTEQMEAQGALDNIVGRLLVIVTTENYPELNGDTIVLGLMDELAGTNNRVAVARMRYIESVQSYNTAIQMFPASIVAGMNGMSQKPNYQANNESQTNPPVVVG